MKLLAYCLFAVGGLVLQETATFPTTCDNGWLPDDGNCYLISHYTLTFPEAEHYCRQHNSHLIEVYSANENAFIKDEFRYLQPHCYWNGLTDEMVEGRWQWYTTQKDANFTDWYPGQPGQDTGDEDCVVFWHLSGLDFKWADIKCNYQCMPVCKRRGYGMDGNEIVG